MARAKAAGKQAAEQAAEQAQQSVPGGAILAADGPAVAEEPAELPEEWISAKAAACAFRAAFHHSAFDDEGNQAIYADHMVVELALGSKDGSHRRMMVKLPETVPIQIIEEL